jgi:phosphatidylglycerophosphatase A
MKKPLLDMTAISLATGLGIGLFPVAPGTAGSLLGPPLVWAVLELALPLPAVLAIGAAFILVGIPICTRASKAMDRHDPGEIVFDEIAAFWIVFLPQIVMSQSLDPLTMCSGFVLFRIFDIAKPWPIQRLEKLPDGTGIMVDDLAAAAYAAVCLLLGTQGVKMLATG